MVTLPKHNRPHRAEVYFTPLAEEQITALVQAADEDAIHRLDRALAVLSADPERGDLIPGSQPPLRNYRDDLEGVRVIYQLTVLRTILIVAYVEA